LENLCQRRIARETGRKGLRSNLARDGSWSWVKRVISPRKSTEIPTPMGMNVPRCDNRKFALNMMHWLSGLTD
jgi:hypothetical protein